MERLTYRVNTGIQDVVLTDRKSVEECLGWENVLKRLAEYEDIGLTPEQLREIDKLYAEKCKELAELEKAPTAYDVDKVVKQLEELREMVPVNRLLDDIIKDKPKELGQLIAYRKAIEIIKSGGIG